MLIIDIYFMSEKGIVCTLGPASWNLMKDLKDAGMSIARINGSFGIPYKKAIEELRQLGVKILVDIPGNRKKTKFSYIQDDDLINFAIENKMDYVGVSYVSNANEIKDIRKTLNGNHLKIVAKIETKEGFENREEIIKEADKILIDRGDLGTSIGFEKVPYCQVEILKDCVRLNTPVIVATEMMMSTIEKTKPNCADVSDVYFAASHGANYVMLSEETAIGKNPIDTVKIMRKILDEIKN